MILIDTQAVLWIVRRPARLSAVAREAIERERRSGGLAIASVTLMELALMASRGDFQIVRTPEGWLRHLVAQSQLVVREITEEIATVAAYLPPGFPGDPFDRLITATAIVERMPLLTSDARIQKSGVVRTIW